MGIYKTTNGFRDVGTNWSTLRYVSHGIPTSSWEVWWLNFCDILSSYGPWDMSFPSIVSIFTYPSSYIMTYTESNNSKMRSQSKEMPELRSNRNFKTTITKLCKYGATIRQYLDADWRIETRGSCRKWACCRSEVPKPRWLPFRSRKTALLRTVWFSRRL